MGRCIASLLALAILTTSCLSVQNTRNQSKSLQNEQAIEDGNVLQSQKDQMYKQIATVYNQAKTFELQQASPSFDDMKANIDKLPLSLFEEFVLSDEFDQLFLGKQQQDKDSDLSLVAEEQDDNESLIGKILENETPLLLLSMGLLGYTGAARFSFLQKRHKFAAFQFVLSSLTLYMAYRTATDSEAAIDEQLLPWVFLVNGVMAGIGAVTVMKDGYAKMNQWKIDGSDDAVDYEVFKTSHNQTFDERFRNETGEGFVEQAKKRLNHIKLDDYNIQRISDRYDLKPATVKGWVGVAVIGSGAVMAAFATKQLVETYQAFDENLSLAATKVRTLQDNIAIMIAMKRSYHSQ